jgi:putative transposase
LRNFNPALFKDISKSEMQQIEQLIQGNYYHIYNRGINSCNLFNKITDYEHFLELFGTYISPVAETFAWVLIPNHFHFLVRIKENVVYKYSNADRSSDAVRFEEHKWETIELADLSACAAPDSVKAREETDSVNANTNFENIKIPKPHLHFSHLFNAYSSYINKRNNRHGALFERPFKRKLIKNETYLKNVVLYIHNNPVHHGFCEYPMEYPWSSYQSCISENPTMLNRDKVIRWFGDEENFKLAHNSTTEIKLMEDWLEI